MSFRSRSISAALLALAVGAPALSAQYFGRNKVRYEDFDFRVLEAPHFDVHYYGAEAAVAPDMARMAERWQTRLQTVFDHRLSERKPIVLYASHADFQQTNITPGFIGEGTGGFTDAARNRVVIPLTSTLTDDDHVLGHELVHVFQYDIASSGVGNFEGQTMNQLPLWLIEGMAEYLSLGRVHPHTAMWLRDEVLRGRRPTIEQLTEDSRFFPYRYGHALWAYIGGRWGDEAVARLYRASLRAGFTRAISQTLGVSPEQLSRDWMDATYAQYGSIVQRRTAPRQVGRPLIVSEEASDMNVSPAVSPDGRRVAFFSGRGLFAIELFIADAQTGRVIRKLASPVEDEHIESIAFTQSAGAWSPDGRKFAFVVVEKGDNALTVLDVASGHIDREIRVPTAGAITGPAWSPDGRTLAFSGAEAGVSDLYLYDFASGTTRRLTNDRFADVQPAWSPDGRTIAFATDRGPTTDFERLTAGALRLALIDVPAGTVRPLEIFPGAKHIDPQFSPSGRDLYFIADRDGVSDVYRYDLTNGRAYQVTRVATGIAGITDNSPGLSVARATGRLVFSVFENSGYGIYALDASSALGDLVTTTPGGPAVAGVLPPAGALGRSRVSAYLGNPLLGLLARTSFPSSDYEPSLGLEYLGAPTLGVSVNRFGTSIGGGIAAFWRDLLGNRSLGVAVQSGNSFKDIGGQLMYENLKHRWQWGFQAGYVPYLTGQTSVGDVTVDIGGDEVPGQLIEQLLQRVYVGQAAGIVKYPFSTTRRLEMSAGYRAYRYDVEIERFVAVGDQVVSHDQQSVPAPNGLDLAEGLVALVGDWSYFGMTSPVQGGRYRFEVAPTFATLEFQTALVDYRRYFYLKPLTFAVRALHYGRYGKDAEADRLTPLFLGSQGFVRGYDVNDFTAEDCTDVAADGTSCPEFDRLIGSRIAVASAEFRLPVLGPAELALIPFPYVPLEISPFADAGVAWSNGQRPDLRFDRATTDRVPVFSAGVAARVNLLGYAVLEFSAARPLQRARGGWAFGFRLAPGW